MFSTARIYDCVFDDAALHGLLADMSVQMGARSFCATWITEQGQHWWTVDSGHWTEEQIALYMRDYAADDVWTAAQLNCWKPGEAVDVGSLVADSIFERSRVKQDFLSAIGDDMRHCVAVGSSNDSGIGAISFHRGTSSNGFDADKVRWLDERAPDLARMVAMRGRFAGVQRRASARGALIDVIDLPVLMVDHAMRLVEANGAAEPLLSGGPLRVAKGVLYAQNPRADETLRVAVERALSTRDPVAGAVALPIGDGRYQPFSVVAAPDLRNGRRHAMLVGTLRQDRCDQELDRLRLLYHLSPSEAALALALANGQSPAEIAEQRGVAVSTVRFQLKSVSKKLGVRRQSEIVGLISSLPPLRYDR